MLVKMLSEPWNPPLQYLISLGLLQSNRVAKIMKIYAIPLKCGESPEPAAAHRHQLEPWEKVIASSGRTHTLTLSLIPASVTESEQHDVPNMQENIVLRWKKNSAEDEKLNWSNAALGKREGIRGGRILQKGSFKFRKFTAFKFCWCDFI